jgi:hypothetical protein
MIELFTIAASDTSSGALAMSPARIVREEGGASVRSEKAWGGVSRARPAARGTPLRQAATAGGRPPIHSTFFQISILPAVDARGRDTKADGGFGE